MTDSKKLNSNYYERFVGKFAKRFYSPFTEENIFRIKGFEVKSTLTPGEGIPYFIMESEDKSKWTWDVEDSIIITDEFPEPPDLRVISIYNPHLIQRTITKLLKLGMNCLNFKQEKMELTIIC